MIKIASAHLWVHDQEVALKFWTEKVGMEVRQDFSLPDVDGLFRWLTVGPPGQYDVSIVLMAVPGEPAMDGPRESRFSTSPRKASPAPSS